MATVYIETTIVSYLTARPSRDPVLAAHQMVTRSWWRGRSAYELLVSQLVLDEASAGDSVMRARHLRALRGLPVLALTDSATHVAKELIRKGALKATPSSAQTSASQYHVNMYSTATTRPWRYGATASRNASGVEGIFRCTRTFPAASRMHTYMVFTWRSIPQ